MRSGWPVLLLAALVLVAFGGTLRNGFTLDDFPFLLENPAVTGPASPLEVLVDARTHSGADVVRTYRPLRTLLFGAEHALFGESAAPYHALNLLLHLACAVLVWRLGRRFLPEPEAVLAAALFAVHPLTAEVVASVKAQDDLVAALAVLGATLLFLGGPERPALGRHGAALFFLYMVGLLAKENAVVLPGLLLAVAWLTRPASDRPLPWRTVGVLAVAGGAWVVLRGVALGAAERAEGELLDVGWRFPSALAQVPRMLALFVWPHPLTADYSHLSVVGLADWEPWASLALLAALGAVAWRSRDVALRLGAAWFALTLLPSLGGVVIFAERFAYLPLVGLCWVAAHLVCAAARRLRLARPNMVAGAVLAALTAMGVLRSRERVHDWRDDEALFRSALAVAPGSLAMRSQLVGELVRQDRVQEAEALLPPWSSLAGTRPASYHERRLFEHHGRIARQRGDWATSAEAFGAIADTPYVQWHDLLDLGTALVNSARPDEARAVFERLLALRPDSAAAQRMLARIELEEQRFGEAAARFAEATRLEPRNALGWYFRVYATWRAAGEAAALSTLAEARASGVALHELFARDEERWDAAGDELRAALRAE